MFEYPVAPDTCATLESRCNYVVSNFWEKFDISRPIKDEKGLMKSFHDYISFFKYAHSTIVKSSIRNFLFKASSNTANLKKIGMAAEYMLYGPYAEYWSDEVYVEFASFLAESTRLSKEERNHYKRQIDVIHKNMLGQVFPDLELVTSKGKVKLSSIDSEVILLFVVDNSIPSSTERVRLSTDLAVNSLVEKKTFTVVQLYMGKADNAWLSSQPENWVSGYCEQAASLVDARFFPSCFLIDKEHKLLDKNLTVNEIKEALN